MDVQKVARQYRLRQWSELISECQSSGMTVKSWCAAQGIGIKNYYYWLKRAREAVCCEMEPIRSQPMTTITEMPVFAEVGRSSMNTAVVTIRMGGAEVELHNGADADIIENTLRAIKRIC